MARQDPRKDADAVRITTAPSNRRDEIATRQRRYLLSMSIRTICFVAAILAALAGVGWLWPIFIAGALILPYVAVVMANATGPREDAFSLPGGLSQHQALPASRDARRDGEPRP